MSSHSVKLELARPISSAGETLHSLELKEPCAKDIAESGFPYTAKETGEVSIDAKACRLLLAKIAAIPPSSVDQLSPADFQEACILIVGFFQRSTATETLDNG